MNCECLKQNPVCYENGQKKKKRRMLEYFDALNNNFGL